MEDLEVFNSRCCGIFLGKYRDNENDMYFYTKHVKSPTQMERDAVCRGQYHGWTKENIGSHRGSKVLPGPFAELEDLIELTD